MVFRIEQGKNQANSTELNRGLIDALTQHKLQDMDVPDLGRARRPTSEERRRPLARRMGRRGAVVCVCI